MKSKRAEEWLNTLCYRHSHDKKDLVKAAEMAEQDARDRAMKALKSIYCGDECKCDAQIDDCEIMIYHIDKFLKAYDNE